jgi:hypothetical protein
VTEVELAALKRDRALLEGLKVEEKALSKNLEEREHDLIARIEAGAEIVGETRPTVKVGSRKSISWLTEFSRLAKRLGLDDRGEVSKVKDEAPSSFFKELLVP